MVTKKIFKNTMMLYVRQVLLLLVGFYTVRVVLDVLGIEDFGIFSLIAGFVALCSFLSNSMTSVTQRFFSFALGKKDELLLKSTFSVNITIYIFIVVLVLAILMGPGLWYFENKISIPDGRFEAALTLYYYSVASFVFTILAAPFLSLIIAHEDMHYFASISVVEVLFKLVLVLFLVYVDGDKLELYGVIQLLISAAILAVYFVICKVKYSECQIRDYHWDYSIFKETCSFTSWTVFGQITTISRVQAVTILLNQYFNPTVVAARAIAITISSKVNIFSSNFNKGMYPGIVKSYSSNDRATLISLIFNGSKLTFFLMWVFVLPLLLEMDYVLHVWLTEVPDYAILFTKLALIESLIHSLSLPLATAARATGKVKRYELYLGCLQISIFAISLLLLDRGHPAETVFFVAIFVNIVMFFVRLRLVSNMINIDPVQFIRKVAIPMLTVAGLSLVIGGIISTYLPEGVVFSMVSGMMCIVISTLLMYFFGLDKEWREKVKGQLLKKLKKLKRKQFA